MFTKLHILKVNIPLYNLEREGFGDWLKVTKDQLERGKLPLVFCDVPLAVREALGVRCQGGSTTLPA